ncbi:hypothetical protein [Robbsia sp. KACC 23696]|uniref:hypothetical protein n=1 Tax=Robbsia sp. KACC 23696 TaxID=3149231 RepID=UPI00325B94CD
MRAFAVSMMAAAVLAGCGKGNTDGMVRTNPVLPDALSMKTVHTGIAGGRQFVTLAVAGGSSYLHFRAQDGAGATGLGDGFYRFDYLSPNKRPLALFTTYRFSGTQVTAPMQSGTTRFDGQGDQRITFDAPSPEGNGRLAVGQTRDAQYETPLTTLSGNYSGFLETSTGKSAPLSLDISGNGTLTIAQCQIVGRADAYTNARAARLRFTVPANNGCGLKALQNVDGILFFENRDSAFLMADQREGDNANGVYGAFTRTVGAR